MARLKKSISFLLALTMVLGTFIFPSPVQAEGKMPRKFDAKQKTNYSIVEEGGLSYKVYNFLDVFETSTSEKNVKVGDLEVSGLKPMYAVRSSNPDLGEEIPNAKDYAVDIQWTTYDIQPDDLGTPVHFLIYEKKSKKIIAQTEDVTKAGLAASMEERPSGKTYKYRFKKLPAWDETGISHDPINWQLRTTNDFRFDIRLQTGPNGHFSHNNVTFNIAQRAVSVYRAEYYTNATQNPRIQAQRTNVDDKTTEVPINDATLTGNDYYSWAEPDVDQVYFSGKALNLTYIPGAQDFHSLKISDDITAGRVKMAMKAPGKTDFDRGPGTFIDNGTPYHYEVTGDYKHLHIFTIRQDLKVNFNPNGAEWKTAPAKDQIIGHSMKLGDSSVGLGPITVPGAKAIKDDTIPKFKDTQNNKELDQEFIGWTLNKTTGADFKDKTEEERKDLLVNFDTYEVKDNVTFYAAYAPKAQAKAEVRYDLDGTLKKASEIDAKYKIANEKYPNEVTGNKDETIKAEVFDTEKAPKFLGYKIKSITTDPVPNPPATANYTENGKYTVIYTYEKLDDIIPAKNDDGSDNTKVTDDVKDTYKKVTIKVDTKQGKFQKNDVDVKDSNDKLISEFVYYVNPVKDKTLQNVLDDSKLTPVALDENKAKIDDQNKWKFDPKQTEGTTAVPATNFALETVIGKDNVAKTGVTMEVNFKQTDAGKFYDEQGKLILEPEDIKVWIGTSPIPWNEGVKLNDANKDNGTLKGLLGGATVSDLGEGGTIAEPKTARTAASANLPDGTKGNLKVTFGDGSFVVVENQTLYVSPLKVKKDDNNGKTIENMPGDKIQVDIKLGEGAQTTVGSEKKKGTKDNPFVWGTFFIKPNTGLVAGDFPAVEAQENYKPNSVKWDPSELTKTWNADGEYIATAEKQTIADKVGQGNLAPVDFGVWKGETIDWKKGVKVADSVTEEDIQNAIKGYLNDPETKVIDATTPARTSKEAGNFTGKLTVKFSDGSTLTVEKQTLYVWEHKTTNDNTNEQDPKPEGAIQVSFANGTGVTALNPENKTMTVKPGTKLETGDFPTATVDEANGYVTPAIWTGNGTNEGKVVSDTNNIFTATANKGKSDKTVIPFEPNDPNKPADKNDPKIPTEDDNHKTVDKNEYVVVAFNVAPKGSGTLTLDKITNKAVISALVKKGTAWSNVTLPTTTAETDYTFWYWTDKTGRVADGDIRTAHFIKSGDEIKPGDPKLPDGFVKVTVSQGEGVKADKLFGKSYAVKKGETLSVDKFPTLEAKDNYREPIWYTGDGKVANNKPEEFVIEKETNFIAKAREVYLTINDATEGDEKITGKVAPGIPAVEVTVNGKKLTPVTVDNGTWTVDVPKDSPLKAGDKIVATATIAPNDVLKAETEVRNKSVTPPYKPTDTEVIGGDDRIDTAGEISKKYYSYADNVVVARKDQFPDALTASVLAKALNAPILLTDSNKLDARTAAEIKRLGAKNVYVIGGENAISSGVVGQLKALAKVTRIGGADRFETSALIAKKVVSLVGHTGKAMIATGSNFADSLSVSPYAAKMGYPILLVKHNQAPKVIKNAISDLGIKSVYILGGDMAVSYKVNKDLPKLIARIGGADRYETSAKIANMFFTNAKEAFMASGQVFADALVVGPVAAMKNVPVLLTQKNVLPKAIKAVIDRCDFDKITIVGLQNAISKEVIDAIN